MKDGLFTFGQRSSPAILASSLGKYPNNKSDDPNYQNHSHPDSGFENVSDQLTAREAYNRNQNDG
jgi:hypothetical protein